jgi:hypothetical protein
MIIEVAMPPTRRRKACCWIFEGAWWRAREVPLVLPFLQALQGSNGGLALSHKTFRSADDLRFWVKRIPKNERAFVYIACHATDGELQPVDGRSKIPRSALLESLGCAQENAIEFLHFGACEMVQKGNRGDTLRDLADASRACWVSGYVKAVDWLPSTLLDLAVVSELFLDFHHRRGIRRPPLHRRAQIFLRTYEQFARNLGFSGLVKVRGGAKLIPERLH